MLDSGNPVQPERAPHDRLDSWKAIAAYLGRDVSTVRRWERVEGLPVHRHRHAARGSAYAFKSELDLWFDSRRGSLEPRRPVEPHVTADDVPAATDRESVVGQGSVEAAASRRRLRAAWVAGAAALAMTVSVVVLSMRSRSAVSPPRFQARDWIVVAEIENRTGDPRL